MKKVVILLLHMRHGGIEKQTINFANELCKDYQVEIISCYDMLSEPAYYVDKRIKITYLMHDKPNKQEFQEAVHKKKIFRILKEGIHAFSILRKKKSYMKKAIQNLEADYVISTRIEYADLLSKYAPSGVKTITQEHLHNDSPEYIKRMQKACRNIDYLVALGPGSKENYVRWLDGNRKIEIVQIPNLLDKVPNLSSDLRSMQIVSVGRLHPVKDFCSLIDVFELVQKQIPEARLTIVGGGEERAKLEAKVKEKRLNGKVIITGMVDKERVQETMIYASVYAMTSLTECFPMVLLESFSCGVPAVAFDVPVGPKAIIKEGENGYLIQNRDKEEMANRIIEILTNKTKREKLGKNAKRDAYQYLPEAVMPKWKEILK